MKSTILYYLFFISTVFLTYGQQINGIIYYQNSGGKTAAGIQVSAFGCNSTYSQSNGMFSLHCNAKKAGQKLKLIIGNTDGEGNKIEVVNTQQLEWLRVPENSNEEPIEIIICNTGQLEQSKLIYYRILLKINDREYKRKLNQIETQRQQRNLDAHTNAILIAQIEELRKERDVALKKIQEQANYIATINKDQASEMVKSAIQKIEQGEDIDMALTILDNDKLKKAYGLALKKKQSAEAEIRQIIEGYKLKISLLLPKFRYKEATLCYQYIIEVHKSNHFDKEELAILYTKAALIMYYDGKFSNALEYHQKSMEILTSFLEPEHSSLGISYGNIGLTYQALGQYKKALEYCKKSIDIQEKTLDSKHPNLAISYNNIASIYQALDHSRKALKYHKKSMDIREEILDPEHPDLATSYNNIGVTYSNLNQHIEALKYHRKAINIQKRMITDRPSDLAKSYNNIALIYNALNQYEKALEYHKKDIDILKEFLASNHPDLGVSYWNMAVTYKETKAFQKAITLQNKCLNIFKESLPGNHPYQKKAFNTLLEIYYAKALEAFRKEKYATALQVFNTLDGYINNSWVLNYIGLCYYHLSNYSKAIESYEKALLISPIIKTQYFYNNIGMAYAKSGQFEEARDAFSAYETLFPDKGRAYRNWGMYYALLNQKGKALGYLQKAVDLGYDDEKWFKADNSIENLRDEEVFVRIMKTIEE